MLLHGHIDVVPGEAEQRLKEAEEGSAVTEQAERDRARAAAFIAIAERG